MSCFWSYTNIQQLYIHPYKVGHCEPLSYDSNNMTLDYFLYENVRQHRLYRNVGALTAIPISFHFFQQ